MTVFIFAGTGDGKKFIVSLLEQAEKKSIEINAHIFCATEYGAEIIKNEARQFEKPLSGGGHGTGRYAGALRGLINKLRLPPLRGVTEAREACEASRRAVVRGEASPPKRHHRIHVIKNENGFDKQNARGKKNIVVHSGRLNEQEMLNEITLYKPDFVIDCTHPFAETVTKNIKAVCENSGCKYLRLLRRTSVEPPASLDIFYVDSVKDAAVFLKDKTGNIFLTTGSKELRCFQGGEFAERVYPRVLPLDESLALCREAGIAAKNIIAMQGPFSRELNRAVIRQINASWLVSKETGAEGGFLEKMNAALAENCRVLVVRPPKEDCGLDADAIISIVFGLPLKDSAGQQTRSTAVGMENGGRLTVPADGAKKKFFPVFQNITNKKFVIVGAGTVALRRLRTLLRFDCLIEIIAPEIREEIKNIQDGRVKLRQDIYREGDCAPDNTAADFVIAATCDRAVNHLIAAECKSRNIPVSVADRREESTFYFPALIGADDLTIGITSDGRNHRAVSGAARRIRTFLEDGA
ncbi:MAG: precorrin-6A reductase [Spirochaetaceae bacterium]|jgi:precorrin-2 dehydrogenase/sirohydrochlorin ferrochelatase/precorrin-6A/cobalt-precorrin-6A reductase|nr:precorrin-6A reductase [Spirochaetaceae bacterium]